MIKKYIVYPAMFSLLFIFIACGGKTVSGGGEAPETATITISPAAVTITASGYPAVDSQFFNIVVKDTATGIPLGNVDITISFSWAVPSPSNLVQLYDGGTKRDSPMTVTTDENGSYKLRMDYWRGSLDYNGTLVVVSGSVTSTATFDVASGAE